MTRLPLLLCLMLSLSFSSRLFAVTFPYGQTGKIVYDLQKGTFEVYERELLILKEGASEVINQQKVIRSTDYKQITYVKAAIKDAFGNGYRHTVVLTRAGLPEMRQVFYTYSDRPYFFCEVVLKGVSLASNNMITIQGILSIAPAELPLLRSLFVPFDNDTFISYDAKKINDIGQNTSAEVTALYTNTSRNGIVAGSVEHEHWKTGVVTTKSNPQKGNATVPEGTILLKVIGGYTEKSLTRDELPHGIFKGKSIKSPKIFFGAFKDWRTGMESYAKSNRIAEPPIVFKWTKPTPVGWNSWGAMQEHISLEKASAVVDFFADSLKGFRNGGVAYIDLDSYWDNMISGGLEGDYSKLKAFADHAKKRGLKPGVYWAPFTDWGFKGGGSRRAEGGNYTFGELWTKTGAGYHDLDGARALDPTHPGTQKRIALVIGKLKACGFEMIKIDFLGHAAIESDHFYDPKVITGMEAYKAGMEYLLKQLDSKMMVYAAISPSLASGRYVQVRRIACDAFKTIKDTEYTLNSVTNGWWQTYLYDYLDADHVVFGTESLGANTARLLSAVVTGTLITGDDFSAGGPWKQRAAALLQNPQILEIIKDGKSFVPAEGDRDKLASEMFVKQTAGKTWVALFNYGNSSKELKFSFSRIGLSAGENYELEDLISHQKESVTNNQIMKMEPGSALIFKVIKK